MRHVLIVVLVAAGFLGARGDAAQRRPNVRPLTTLDIIEIQQLAIRYAYGLDSGADDGHMYADVFTPDGEFVGRQVPLTQGRELPVRAAFHHQPCDRTIR
jgi:hypothetical protein